MQMSEEMVGCKFKLNSLEEEGKKECIGSHKWPYLGLASAGWTQGSVEIIKTFSSPSWTVCSLIGSILHTGPFHGGGKRATSGFSLIFSQCSNSS